MSTSSRPNGNAGSGGRRARRRYSRLFTLRCTECHALLLSLWKGREPGDRWRAAELTGCVHVKRADVERWRFTPREQRNALGLPIYAPTGGRGPRPASQAARAGG